MHLLMHMADMLYVSPLESILRYAAITTCIATANITTHPQLAADIRAPMSLTTFGTFYAPLRPVESLGHVEYFFTKTEHAVKPKSQRLVRHVTHICHTMFIHLPS